MTIHKFNQLYSAFHCLSFQPKQISPLGTVNWFFQINQEFNEYWMTCSCRNRINQMKFLKILISDGKLINFYLLILFSRKISSRKFSRWSIFNLIPLLMKRAFKARDSMKYYTMISAIKKLSENFNYRWGENRSKQGGS